MAILSKFQRLSDYTKDFLQSIKQNWLYIKQEAPDAVGGIL